MLPEGRFTDRHEDFTDVDDLDPSRMFVREVKGGSKEADDEVRSPPTI
jgi:hypothetical protein